MELNTFIDKYTYLCDKNHHLIIHFGNSTYNKCFNNNINVRKITSILNYLENNKYRIINNDKGQIAVYFNEYLNITNNSITEYTIIDSIIDTNMLIKFSEISKNKNICSFKYEPHDQYDYELVTIEIDDGCNIDILKKYDKNDINNYIYNLTLYVYKPCKIIQYINDILKIIN
jgi:hypothetical protein